jgi:hypothetical protein
MAKQKQPAKTDSQGQTLIATSDIPSLSIDQMLMQLRNASVDDLVLSISLDYSLFMGAALAADRIQDLCGLKLLVLWERLRWGDWRKVYEEQYQERLGVGFRQAQRYIARAKSKLAEGTLLIADGDSDLLEKGRVTLDVSLKPDAVNGEASNSTDEWATPAEVLGCGRTYLQVIGCDPCAAESRQDFLPEASCVYTRSTDGLAATSNWTDRAWVAPGHTVDIEPWLRKAICEITEGDVQECLLFLPLHVALGLRLFERYPVVFLHTNTVLRTPATPTSKPRTQRAWMCVVLLAVNPEPDRLSNAFRDIGFMTCPNCDPAVS